MTHMEPSRVAWPSEVPPLMVNVPRRVRRGEAAGSYCLRAGSGEPCRGSFLLPMILRAFVSHSVVRKDIGKTYFSEVGALGTLVTILDIMDDVGGGIRLDSFSREFSVVRKVSLMNNICCGSAVLLRALDLVLLAMLWTHRHQLPL